jgi:hypothetical protein
LDAITAFATTAFVVPGIWQVARHFQDQNAQAPPIAQTSFNSRLRSQHQAEAPVPMKLPAHDRRIIDDEQRCVIAQGVLTRADQFHEAAAVELGFWRDLNKPMLAA